MSNKLFVGGLPWAVNDEKLRETFSSYGEITEAKVIMDRETGRSRGFGFVTFAEESNAQNALELDGTELDGRRIRVDLAHGRGGGRR
ncbi:MAG: RNA-binding protein [Deltaproteobacteria bacterium]|nr:RNA-binding protein [Deltaproteobacteria bacterium]